MLTSREVLISFVGASILMIVVPSFLNHFYNLSKLISDSPIVLTPFLLFLYFKLKKSSPEKEEPQAQPHNDETPAPTPEISSSMSSYISVLKTLHS